MKNRDFDRLNQLIQKLSSSMQKASKTDGSFKKYHNKSLEVINELPHHLKHIEQGLRTAKLLD
ncbi:MAG: hypothetical protein GY705_12055 [Bacteroidetes bacterium]|nr:hypothetical protein [Bacteroidota bacterium]